MIQIRREEKDVIAKVLPDVYIVRTMKQKSKRGKYYMCEDPRAMALLRELRGEAQPGDTVRGDDVIYDY